MAFSNLAGNDDSAMNLSSSLNNLFRRADSRTLFARQGSDSQSYFMRRSSVTQAISPHQDGPVICYGLENTSRLYATPRFSRPSQRSVPQECKSSVPHKNLPSNFYGSFHETSEAPKFSRPAGRDPQLFSCREQQSGQQEHEISAMDSPKFARSDRRISEQKQPLLQKLIRSACSRRIGTGTEWSPRADIAAFGSHYIVTVELPGVCSSDIKVELNDRNLIVTGKRSTRSWRMMRKSVDSDPSYLQKEIIQGPYQFVWSLPGDVDKKGASAEFVDGFLEISLPRHSLAKL